MDYAAVSTIFAQTDRELWLVTARSGSQLGGLIATFVCHASLPPEMPRVLVAIARHHHTWQLIEESGALALHLISEDQLNLVWRFGLASGRDVDKFAGLSVHSSLTGSPILEDSLAWLDCRVEARFETGDRTAFLAKVVEAQYNRREPPLTMHRLLKLAPPENLQAMRHQREHDSALDAAAILQWRDRG